MLGLFYDKTYRVMKNYDNGDKNRDNDRNKDGNDNDNATSASGYGGPIVYSIITPWSCKGGLVNNGYITAAVAHYASTRWTIYLPY